MPKVFQVDGVVSAKHGAVDMSYDPLVYEVLGRITQIRAWPVPEPATMLLLASGLFGLAGVRKRFKK